MGRRAVLVGSCPDCGVSGSIVGDVCDLCLADLGEYPSGPMAAALPPAAAKSPLRFRDVVAELQHVAELAAREGNGGDLMAAADRAERLLSSLRRQFLQDIGLRQHRRSRRVA